MRISFHHTFIVSGRLVWLLFFEFDLVTHVCCPHCVVSSLVCPSEAPVIEIPGFTHPVSDLYLHDVLHATRYVPPHFTRLSAMITAQHAAQSSPFILLMGFESNT